MADGNDTLQAPPSKLKRLYEFLKKKKAVSDSYEVFEKAMQDDKKLQKVHSYLSKSEAAKNVPQDFGSFKSGIFPQQEVKEPQAPVNDPLLEQIQATNAEAPQVIQQNTPLPFQAPEKITPEENSKIFNDIIEKGKKYHDLIKDGQADIPTQKRLDQDKAKKEYDQAIELLNKSIPRETQDELEKQGLRRVDEFVRTGKVEGDKNLQGYLNAFAGNVNESLLKLPSNILKGVAIGAAGIENATGYSDWAPSEVEKKSTYQIGEKWNNFIDKKFGPEGEFAQAIGAPEGYENTFASQLGSGVGSLLSMMIARNPIEGGATQLTEQGVVKSVGELAKKGTLDAAKFVGKGLSYPQGLIAGTFAVDEFENAKNAGMSDEESFKVFLKNYFVNQTDIIPIETAFTRLNKLFSGSIAEKVLQIGGGGIIEGSQEGLQSYLTNKIAQGSYDPDRDPLFQVLESVSVGGILGMLLPVISSVASKAPKDVKKKLIDKAKSLEDTAINLETKEDLVAPSASTTETQSREGIVAEEPNVKADEVQAEGGQTGETLLTPKENEDQQPRTNTMTSKANKVLAADSPTFTETKKSIDDVGIQIDDLRKNNPKEFKKDGTPRANSKITSQYNDLTGKIDELSKGIQVSMEEEFSIRAENENEISRQETEKINLEFEQRQKELEKYLPEEDRIEEEVFDKINSLLSSEDTLSSEDVAYLNENAFKPEGFIYNSSGSLVKEENLQQNAALELQPSVEEGGGNKKSLLNRAFKGENSPEVTKAIEKHGLTYETESHITAKENATNFIKDVGVENAIEAVRKNQIEDGAAAFVWAQAIDSVQDDIANTTDEGELAKLNDLQAQLISEFDVKARSGGRFISALQEVYKASDFNYSTERQSDIYKQNNKKGTIPKEVEDKFKELESQLKDINAQLKEKEKEIAKVNEDKEFIRIKEQFEQERGRRKKVAAENRTKIATFFDSLKVKDVKGTANDITRVLGAAVWNGSVEAMKAATLAGYDVANVIQAGIRYVKEHYKGNDFKEDDFVKEVEGKVQRVIPKVKGKKGPDAAVREGKVVIPESVIKRVIEDGAQDINELVSVIHSELVQDNPDLTEREVRDAITKYGQTKNLSQDEIKKKIREFKRVGRLVSALEDVQKKIRPLRSGLQRDKLTDQERRMQRELKEAMKELPVSEADIENQLKTTLDAIKSRLKNQISDLENQITTKTKTPKRKGVEYDQEATDLKAERDRLKEIVKQSEGEQEVPIEERINRAIGRLQGSIDEYERRIKEGEIEAKQAKQPVTSPKIEDLKKIRDSLRETIKKMQDDAGITDRKRMENAKKSINASIAEYERRINEGDFVKKPKREIIADDELTKLRAHKLAVKNEFDKLQYKNQLNNRTLREEILDGLVEFWGLTRALRATGEFSFVLIQGGVYTLSHPIEAAKAFVTAMNHFASQKRHDEWLNNVKSQDYYDRAKASKLAITEPNVKISAREEVFLGGWVNYIWDILGTPFKLAGKAAYDKWRRANPISAVERAGLGYLNTMRLSRYLKGEEMLELQGKNFKDNPQDYKNVADVINTFSGRASLGAFEKIAKPLSIVFFSPRNWASIIKQATPYAFYHFGKMGSKGDPWYKPSVAQKMAMGDYMRYVALTGSIISLVLVSQDDDDKDGWKVEMDPRSSDYLKLRRGNTVIDPWGGRQQMIVLQARLIADMIDKIPNVSMMAYKNSKGELLPLGIARKSDNAFGLLIRTFKNKLAPSSGLLVKSLDRNKKSVGKDTYIDTDPFGNLLNMEDELVNNLYPIFWETMSELHEDQPETLAYFLDFLAFFGIGTQTYDPVKQKAENKKKIREIMDKNKGNQINLFGK